jgi:hypothetical protein
MTVRFYTHLSQKRAEALALVDSGATENFINLGYARWLGLPIHALDKPRKLFNVDGTQNKAGDLKYYTDLSVQTGGQQTNHRFYLSDLGDHKAILGYPWFTSTQPKIDLARGWIDASHLPIILRTNDTQRIQFLPRTRNVPRPTTIARQVTKILAKPTTNLPTYNIPPEELKTIPQEYRRHLKVFSETQAQRLPPDWPWNHAIDLKPDALSSIRGRIYPLTQLENKALKKHLKQQLAKGYIRPSKSPYAAPFFFIKKKNRTLRPIYDYWQLNQWTIKNHYPLPLISELIYRLRGCNRFTTFDIRDGYNNLKIKPEDIWKGAFLTNRGLFEPVVLLFGICNAPASFQAMTNSIFRDFIDEGWLTIYMDDIIVHMTEEESLEDHRRKSIRY